MTILNTKVLLVLAIPLLILIYLFANKPNGEDTTVTITQSIQPNMWQDLDLLLHELPPQTNEVSEKVQIKQSEQNIGGVETFIQKAEPPDNVSVSGKIVLLLHGAAFTSQTWVDQVPTIATLAALGHRVFAIDLPGFGKSKVLEKADSQDKGSYLAKVIDELTPNVRPVVVTPSMSGSFIIPLLKVSPEKVSAWVPVAPVDTEKGKKFFSKLDVPTLIVLGELDSTLGVRSRDNLISIPTSTKPQVLPRAKHPAYLDQPELWHQLLYNFISALPA